MTRTCAICCVPFRTFDPDQNECPECVTEAIDDQERRAAMVREDPEIVAKGPIEPPLKTL